MIPKGAWRLQGKDSLALSGWLSEARVRFPCVLLRETGHTVD
jgi:hypothetical protein